MGNEPISAQQAKIQFEDYKAKYYLKYNSNAISKAKSIAKKIIRLFLKSKTSCLHVILQLEGHNNDRRKDIYPTFRFEYKSHIDVLKSTIESFGYVVQVDSFQQRECYYFWSKSLFQWYRTCRLIITF